MEIIDPKRTKERMDERLEMMHKLYSNSEVKHIFSPSEPKTNADRIRSMTDEELAVFLGNTKAFCCRDRDPSEEFIAEFKTWLKQEAVDNGACLANETSEKVKEEEDV